MREHSAHRTDSASCPGGINLQFRECDVVLQYGDGSTVTFTRGQGLARQYCVRGQHRVSSHDFHEAAFDSVIARVILLRLR